MQDIPLPDVPLPPLSHLEDGMMPTNADLAGQGRKICITLRAAPGGGGGWFSMCGRWGIAQRRGRRGSAPACSKTAQSPNVVPIILL